MNKNTYIDIKDVPKGVARKASFPYDEWASLPVGKALEVTAFDGRSAIEARRAIFSYLKYHNSPLKVHLRGERVFISHPGKGAIV